MSQRLIILDEAEEELIEAQKWYETQRSGLGEEFRRAIDEAMERLLKAPLAASTVVNLPPPIGARRVLVKRLPYQLSSSTTTRISGSLHLLISIGARAIGENDLNRRSLPT